MMLNALAIQTAFIELTGKAARRSDIDPNQASADMELTGQAVLRLFNRDFAANLLIWRKSRGVNW